MYIGEAGNLHDRLKEHFETSQKGPTTVSLERPIPIHEERLRHLFTTFETLTVRYHVIKATQDERKTLERTLICLLDPPFNLNHRPKPTGVPTVGSKYPLAMKAAKKTSLFGN